MDSFNKHHFDRLARYILSNWPPLTPRKYADFGHKLYSSSYEPLFFHDGKRIYGPFDTVECALAVLNHYLPLEPTGESIEVLRLNVPLWFARADFAHWLQQRFGARKSATFTDEMSSPAEGDQVFLRVSCYLDNPSAPFAEHRYIVNLFEDFPIEDLRAELERLVGHYMAHLISREEGWSGYLELTNNEP